MTDFDEAFKELQRSRSFESLEVLSSREFEETDIIMYEGRRCVRKVLSDDLAKASVYDILKMEQDIGSQLDCAPYIYEIIDTGVEKTIITELLQGCTLEDLCEDSPMSLENVRLIFPLILECVTELHNCSLGAIIHRDLKPSNIFLYKGGTVKLIDFGIARVENVKERGGSDTTLFGTKSYAPPEQFGYAQTTVRSDIFALGGVLCCMLTGKSPESGDVIDPSVEDMIPKRLVACINRARAFDPEKRYKSCEAFLFDFNMASDAEIEKTITYGSNIRLLTRLSLTASHIYNFLILALLGLFWIGCICVGFDYSLMSSHGSYAQGLVTLIFGMAVPAGLIAFLLYSKKPILIKHPDLKFPKVWQQILAIFAEFAFYLLLFFILNILNI